MSVDLNDYQYEGRNEPYDGCLVIMNVGDETEADVTVEQREILSKEVDDAHANGWLVIYAFDSHQGVSKPPAFVEVVEDMDFPVLARAVFEVDIISFEYQPYLGKQEFSDFVSHVYDGHGIVGRFKFDHRTSRIVGFATVDGQKVFIPPMAV